MPSKRQLQDLGEIFKALGSPHRVAIVSTLLKREMACCSGDRAANCTLDAASCNVGSIGESLDIDASTLSHHLKELDRAGLIERARRGRQIYCRVNRARLDQLRSFLTPPEVSPRFVTLAKKPASRPRPAA
ncbi:MAG: ArsR/SmtB family transcription factor [Gemmatimonadaceae bacterium]